MEKKPTTCLNLDSFLLSNRNSIWEPPRGQPRLENKKKKKGGKNASFGCCLSTPLNGAGFPSFVGVVLVAFLGAAPSPPLLLGGAASFCLIVFLFLVFFFIFKLWLLSLPPSFVWCRLPLLHRGASWSLPPLGGAAFPSPLLRFPFLFVLVYFVF